MQTRYGMMVVVAAAHAAVAGLALSQVEAAAAGEAAAAEADQPSGFFDGWEGRFQFGLFGTSGNSESNTLEFFADGERDSDHNRTYYELLYNFSRSDGEIGTNNARLTLGNDFKVPDEDWFAFIKGVSEFDELAAWDGRFTITAGLGYTWIDTETRRFISRLGGGAELEVGSAETAWSPLVTFENDFFQQISDRQEFSAFVDFLIDVGDTENVRVNAGAEYSWLIDPSNNMSLVGRVETEFDAQPGVDSDTGDEDNEFDTSYSLLLSWEY